MHGCGSGLRLSSLRMFVSSWSRISRVSAASLSRERFEEVRHVCWMHGQLIGRIRSLGAYQEVSILLLEPVQALRGVFGLVLTGAPGGEGAHETRPLDLVSSRIALLAVTALTKSMAFNMSRHAG